MTFEAYSDKYHQHIAHEVMYTFDLRSTWLEKKPEASLVLNAVAKVDFQAALYNLENCYTFTASNEQSFDFVEYPGNVHRLILTDSNHFLTPDTWPCTLLVHVLPVAPESGNIFSKSKWRLSRLECGVKP